MGDIVRLVRGGRFIGWYVRFKDVDGRRKMRASHQPTKQAARRYLLEVEGRIARGAVGIPEPAAPAPTVAELVERFLADYSRPKIKDLQKYRMLARCALRRALAMIGERPADGLQSVDVAKLRDGLGRKYAAASVRTSLAFLGTVFAWAVKAGLLPANPCRGVERPPQLALVEFLHKEDVARLIDYARAHAPSAFPMIATALYTGMRKGELFGLRWSDLSLDARQLNVMRSCRTLPKGGQPRHLRLPATLVPVLLAWRLVCPRTPENLVFPVVRSGIPRMGSAADMEGLHDVLAQAGCVPLRRPWHALRHTFASHYLMSGGNILSLQKILGHHDVKMTQIYAHLAPDFLGGEMDRLTF